MTFTFNKDQWQARTVLQYIRRAAFFASGACKGHTARDAPAVRP